MASLIERIAAQHAARETHSIEIPEWGENNKPQVIRYKTPTLAILSKVRKDSKDDEVKMMAMLIVAVSLDENGNQLFRPMNWADLFNSADPGVVQRIGDAVMSKVRFDAAAVEDAEKN